ncbi:M24 family metallopeptidase [Candidatus Omnitrophota bacterium]
MTPPLRRLYAVLEKKHLDALLISHQPNITYLTGFLSSDSYLLITARKNFFITDTRYYEQARSALKGFKIKLGGKSIFSAIAELAASCQVKRLGFEARNLDVSQYHKIKKFLTDQDIRFTATQNIIEELRKLKSRDELLKIRKAVNISVGALKFARRIIRAGRREIEIAAELERFIRYNGARAASFETIVASGKNTAFAHHLTSRRRIQQSEPVFIDLGVDYLGYKSDLTRVFFLGKIPSTIRVIYDVVLQAQTIAINKIKPGIKICEVDKSARQHIANKGYGGFFGHNLGHGIGLEIHEKPSISALNKESITEGMVFSVEPAVYLPGRFGIRIEEDILVTKKGCEVLSDSLDK